MSNPMGTRSLLDCLHCEYRTERQFCNLDHAALADFDLLGHQSEVKSGDLIFSEDSPTRGVFVLCRGKVKLSTTSKLGRTLILRIAGPGDVLGLGAVVSGDRYEVTAEAIEPAELKCIRQDEFLAFLEKHGEGSMHAARALSTDYRTTFFDARRLALSSSAAARLASVLLDWARASRCSTTEIRFTMALTHEELANLIGSSRETVTRLLGRFRREKLIDVRGATIVILAKEKLDQMAV